jgi:hypothetical protein
MRQARAFLVAASIVLASPGVARALEPTAEPPPATSMDWRLPAGNAGVSASAAMFGVAIFSMVQIKSAQDTLDPFRKPLPESTDVCDPGFKLAAQVKDTCSKGHTFQAVEIASFTASGVLLGLGTYFLISHRPSAAVPRVQVLPSMGPRGASLDVIARF